MHRSAPFRTSRTRLVLAVVCACVLAAMSVIQLADIHDSLSGNATMLTAGSGGADAGCPICHSAHLVTAAAQLSSEVSSPVSDEVGTELSSQWSNAIFLFALYTRPPPAA